MYELYLLNLHRKWHHKIGAKTRVQIQTDEQPHKIVTKCHDIVLSHNHLVDAY